MEESRTSSARAHQLQYALPAHASDIKSVCSAVIDEHEVIFSVGRDGKGVAYVKVAKYGWQKSLVFDAGPRFANSVCFVPRSDAEGHGGELCCLCARGHEYDADADPHKFLMTSHRQSPDWFSGRSDPSIQPAHEFRVCYHRHARDSGTDADHPRTSQQRHLTPLLCDQLSIDFRILGHNGKKFQKRWQGKMETRTYPQRPRKCCMGRRSRRRSTWSGKVSYWWVCCV